MNSLLINSDQADKVTSSILKNLYTYIYMCVNGKVRAQCREIFARQSYVLEDRHIRQHRCKDLKFRKVVIIFFSLF
jgi:hypothetical protein